MTAIKELMDWIDKEIELGEELKELKGEFAKGYISALFNTKKKLKEFIKKDIKRYRKDDFSYDLIGKITMEDYKELVKQKGDEK